MKIQYESLTDFYKDAKMTQRIDGSADEIQGYMAEWVGISSKSAIEKSKYSYENVVNYAEIVKQLYTVKKITSWNSDDGDDMCPERYMDGRAFMSRRVRVCGDRHNKGASKKIIINASVSWSVDAESIINKACAAMKIADDIEQQGVATDVYVAFNIVHPWKHKKDNAEIMIKVKGAGSQVGVGMIGAALAPWFLRVWIFGWIEKRGIPAGNYGLVKGIERNDFTEGAIIIEKNDCMTKPCAEEFIKKVVD